MSAPELTLAAVPADILEIGAWRGADSALALPRGLLLVTPASTARHLREWLGNAGRPFGLVAAGDVSVAGLVGERVI